MHYDSPEESPGERRGVGRGQAVQLILGRPPPIGTCSALLVFPAPGRRPKVPLKVRPLAGPLQGFHCLRVTSKLAGLHSFFLRWHSLKNTTPLQLLFLV